MATSNPESSTGANWGSPFSNGTLASGGPSSTSPNHEDTGNQSRQQGDGFQQTNQSQQLSNTPLELDHQRLGTTYRHPSSSRRCLSHSNSNVGNHPETGPPGPNHSPANDLTLQPTPHTHRRAVSLPPALEAFIDRDVERYEEIAVNGITPGTVEGNGGHDEQLSEPETTILLEDNLPGPVNGINGGPVPDPYYEATRGVGGWCCPPPWS